MRVIGGVAKGRRIFGARGTRTRPIAENVKKSLFDILAPRVPGAKCLDLFAGTGALGIEAMSRGAECAAFVECNARMVETIKKNLDITGFSERARVIRGDVRRVVPALAQAGEAFDIVFVDPPYDHGLAPPIVELLCSHGLLRRGGIIVARHERRQEMPASCEGAELARQERFGDTVVSFYSPGS